MLKKLYTWLVARLFGNKLKRILAQIDFETLLEIYQHMSSKDARRQTAVEVLMQACFKNKIPMTESQASYLVDQITTVIGKTRK